MGKPRDFHLNLSLTDKILWPQTLMPQRDLSMKPFPCLVIWCLGREFSWRVTKYLYKKAIYEDAFLVLVRVRAPKVKEHDWVLFCCITGWGKSLVMFHGIYAIRTMTSSQSKTPNHLNSSTQSQPEGYKITSWEKEGSIHILGTKGINILDAKRFPSYSCI